MKNSLALLAGVSSAALAFAAPASGQTVPEPGGTTQGEIDTGAGADDGQAGDSQSGTTQSAEPAASAAPVDDGSGDIVVTAQRRSETLQTVPISVSAFTGEALERQQIENASDLQLSLPNVTFTKTNFTASSFTIRGIGDLCVGFSCDQATAIHVNDMPLTSTRLFETEYFDLDRVEVLRGPQGTLFGRNATSGVVNFITAKPNLSRFAMSGSFEVGNYQSVKLNGMINVPITDTIGVRLAGYFLTRDGFTKNIFDDSRVDGRELYALRGSLRWRPSESTTLDIVAYRFNEDDDRSRVQKQLCNNDPTGVLGCSPDKLEYETVNGKSTLAAILSSNEFFALNNPALAPFGLGSINPAAPDVFFGGIENPDDLRTVNIDFKPTYKAKETHLMARLEQDLGSSFSLTVTGGYAKNSVDSRTDYNLVAGNSLANNPGLIALGFTGFLTPANPFTPVAQALIPGAFAALVGSGGTSVGPVCTSEVNLENTGVYGGFVNRCTAGSTDYDRSQSNSRQYSLEAHLDSNFDGPFNFLVGGILLDNKFTNSNYYVASFGLDYAAGILGAATTLGAGGALPNLFLAPPFYNNETNLFRLKSFGVFGEATYEFTDRLKLTAGLRYSRDRKRQRDRTSLVGWAVPFGETDADNSPFIDEDAEYTDSSVKFGRVTGRAVLDYRLTRDNLLYASYSRGYKSGGINPAVDPIFNVNRTFEPESIDAFEIGSKNTFADGAVRLNLSGFYYNYKGLQLSRIIQRTSVNDNTDATIWGAEAEAVFRPTRDLLINASASYLKSKIKSLELFDPRDPTAGRSDVVLIKDVPNAYNCVVAPTAGGSGALANAFVNGFNANPAVNLPSTVPVPGTNANGTFSSCENLAAAIAGAGLPLQVLNGIDQDLSGNELPQSPNWKLSAGAQYTFRFGNGMTLVPRADVNWTGKYYSRSFNAPIDRIDSFAVVNAQLQLNSGDDRWYARAFVQNLTNNDAITGQYVGDQSSGLYTNVFTLEPRVYGIGAGVKF